MAKYMDWLLYHRGKIPSDLSPRRGVAEPGVWPCRGVSGAITKGRFQFGLLPEIRSLLRSSKQHLEKNDWSWLIALLLTDEWLSGNPLTC